MYNLNRNIKCVHIQSLNIFADRGLEGDIFKANLVDHDWSKLLFVSGA
jgi:hypothetical protein